MTRDEYNKKVQAIQEVWPDAATRFDVLPGRVEGTISESRFEVYFDRWITLGVQRRPFQADADYEWDEMGEIKVMARFAEGVTSDRIARYR